jgi:hypothetical protein
LLAARRLDQDAAHRLGRGGQKMATIGELLIANQTQVRLVHQRGGVHGMPRFFVSEFLSRQTPQLIVNQRPAHLPPPAAMSSCRQP